MPGQAYQPQPSGLGGLIAVLAKNSQGVALR